MIDLNAIETTTTLPELEAYYDGKSWWCHDNFGQWRKRSEKDITRKLASRGLRADRAKGQPQSDVDRYLMLRQDSHPVDYAGAVAGYDSGFIEMCGNRVLVTRGVKLITPVQGPFPLLTGFLTGLLNGGPVKQLDYLFGWWQIALRTLYARALMPGHVLALVGPAECGKSLVQKITTLLFGGRSAIPRNFLSDSTIFTSDLVKAEHLMMEDCSGGLSHPERIALGERIKGIAVNETQLCQGKYEEGLVLAPFSRFSMSLNDSGENLTALPPIDATIEDKILILKCTTQAMPMDTSTYEGRAAFNKAWAAELPHLIYYLLHEYQLPPELKTGKIRCGMRAFQHPDIIEAMGELSSEARLLSYVDQAMFVERQDERRDKAVAFESLLLMDPEVGYQVKKLLNWNNAMGTLLGRLAEKYPHRVKKAPNYSQNREWILMPPT